MVEKDEMIKKAKMQDEIKTQGLEEFVKSLTDEKLARRRVDGKAKLQRKNLIA